MTRQEQLDRLAAAMKEIKEVAKKHDVAGSFILTAPDPDNTEDSNCGSVTIKSLFLETSFSLAKTFKHYSCEACGMVEGILIDGYSTTMPADQKRKKFFQSIGLILALGKATWKNDQKFVAALKEISAQLTKMADGSAKTSTQEIVDRAFKGRDAHSHN